jgi:hypothetical protein
MFWQSVILGLQAFGDWHIWVGNFGMIVLRFIWRLISGLVTGGAESGIRAATGCIMSSLGEIIVEALAVSLFALFCLPSIVLREGFTPAVVVSNFDHASIKSRSDRPRRSASRIFFAGGRSPRFWDSGRPNFFDRHLRVSLGGRIFLGVSQTFPTFRSSIPQFLAFSCLHWYWPCGCVFCDYRAVLRRSKYRKTYE